MWEREFLKTFLFRIISRKKEFILGRGSVFSGKDIFTFQRNLLPPSSCSTMKIEAVGSTELSVLIHKTTRRHNPSSLHIHRLENVHSLLLEKKLLARSRNISKNNIKMDLMEKGYENAGFNASEFRRMVTFYNDGDEFSGST
jgi:hypothetical protein